MRKLLFILLLMVGAVIGLGFYLDWFSISTTRDAETGKTGVELNIDKDKMKSDTQKARDKIGNLTEKAKGQGEEK